MTDSNDNFSPRAWLELALVPNVPLHAKLKFLAHWHSPKEVLEKTVNDLKQIFPAVKDSLADQVPTQTLDEVFDWIESGKGSWLLLTDEQYPSALTQRLEDAPLGVFVQGDLSMLDSPIVAFVGSSKASKRALERARTFAYELSQEQICVAAGISPGIAQAALQGVQTSSTGSIGVIGDARSWEGLRLASDTAKDGLLVSEFAPRTGQTKGSYAWRYRLLPALANVVVIIEADLNCDTLKLADSAGDLGCEIATIPADPDNTKALGNNRLLKEGAALVESSADILRLLSI